MRSIARLDDQRKQRLVLKQDRYKRVCILIIGGAEINGSITKNIIVKVSGRKIIVRTLIVNLGIVMFMKL